MIALAQHPRQTMQSADGWLMYNLPAELTLPFPRRPLVPVVFESMTVVEVETEMLRRKTAWEASAGVDLIEPPLWENIGYVDEGDRITAYYQVGWVSEKVN